MLLNVANGFTSNVAQLNSHEKDENKWLCKTYNDKAAKRITIGTPDSKDASTTNIKEDSLM